jgi:hypothetical protein
VSRISLSLWNGYDYRADLQNLIYVDSNLFQDMLTLWTYLYQHNLQLESIVTKEDIAPVIRAWREVLKGGK